MLGEQQRPALELRRDIHPRRGEGAGHVRVAVLAVHVDAALAPVEPVAKELSDSDELLGRGLVEPAEMLARSQFGELAFELAACVRIAAGHTAPPRCDCRPRAGILRRYVLVG